MSLPSDSAYCSGSPRRNPSVAARVYFGLLVFLLFSAAGVRAESISLRSEDARWIAGMIFQNECALKTDCLVTWNDGEDFLSLGIGHFIWYPAGRPDRYRESFPDFLRDFQKRGLKVPDWLPAMIQNGPPWKTRAEFLAAQNSPEVLRLRAFLNATMSQQAAFMIRRFQEALLKMLQITEGAERSVFVQKILAMTQTKYGLYAMIDYLNFKGDGLSVKERYHAFGWGLFQVLREMSWPAGTEGTEADFVEAARKVLRRRVDNAPSERQEDRWIQGWVKRVGTYSLPEEMTALIPDAANPVPISEAKEPVEIANLGELKV